MMTTGEREVLDKVQEGFRRVGLTFPYLAGLIQKIQVVHDRRVPTMGIFASGRLAVNPEFVSTLSAPDLLFVLAHELYHLMLRTHQRAEGTDALDFNHAHDYIINDLLRHELQVPAIPAGGLDWPGARLLSAEKILGEMRRDPSLRAQQCWDALMGEGKGEGEGTGPPGDVLDSAVEREMFPETRVQDQQARTQAVREQADRALSLQALMESMSGRGRGTEAGGQQDVVAALRGRYRPPWELALQRWMESVAPSERTYARPSRRGADRTDLVLPGRKREGWTLHIVLDTSGSMVEEIPRALGAIADFCAAIGVDRIHLVQCDTTVGRDEILAPAEVARWQITGYGGSDLGPAMLRLAEDPDVGAAIVLTDGDIAYPEQPMPYSVLWVLPAWKTGQDFTPQLRQGPCDDARVRCRLAASVCRSRLNGPEEAIVKVIEQLITYLEERGRLRPRHIEELVAKGYWGQYTSSDLRLLEHKVGQSFFFQVTGEAFGPVWGSDVYTSDSSLETACVHAGLLKPGEAGVVKVTMMTPIPIFQGTTRNGVTSRTWTNGWSGAYRVEAFKK